MAMKFTEEQLNSFDKSMLIQLFFESTGTVRKGQCRPAFPGYEDAGNDGTADPG